jgi:acyl-CoA synthetase (NDP forming)
MMPAAGSRTVHGKQTKPGSESSADLEALFRPRSIAVVGASANERSRGYQYVKALVDSGFPGPLYPVNPKLDELLGLKAYPRLEAIPGPVDFVISAVPAAAVLDLVEGARAKKARLIHFFTARFGETGREDAAELEMELRNRIREAGIRVIGPNCMGLYYPREKITFDSGFPRESGNVGLLTQSGSHAFRVIMRGGDRGVRFSKVISYGNALDLNEADLLLHFAEDPDTEVIAAYVEGVRDGRRFFEALRHAASRKPVVILKGGRTAAGRVAAASHTAALASQQTVWQAAVRQAGALEVGSLDDLIDMVVALTLGGPANGSRVGVLGGAGGEAVETADICHEAGLDVAPLPEDLRESLRDKLPQAWDWVGNPVDGSILGWGRFEALEVVQMMAASPAYDLIFVNARSVEHMLNQEDGEKLFGEAIDILKRLGPENGKATMVVMGEPEFRDERRWKAAMDARDGLAAAGVAVYSDFGRAARAMGRYVRYMAKRQEREAGKASA